MAYKFTSESVSEGHPDKVADQISDALVDEFLRCDPNSKVACETLVTTGLVVCAGEVRTTGYVDLQNIVRTTLKQIGYTKAEYQFEANSCGVISTLHEQSGDIFQGVNREDPESQGAGDQGMMFGYACREQDNYMPLPIEIAHDLLHELAHIRKEELNLMPYLRPDAKSQVTMEYDDNGHPVRIETIVISTQHDDFIPGADPKEAEQKMQARISEDVRHILIPRVLDNYEKKGNKSVRKLFEGNFNLHVNPTGKFVIGGPHGDSGLTGRKIIVDTYGGRGAHGGGAFSGKDSSKVDRSAAYAMRHIAKNLVAAGVADEVLVQVAYAIGISEPVGLYINTYGTSNVKDNSGNKLSDGQIAEKVRMLIDLRPYAIIKRLGLKNPVFFETSKYGHFGRDYYEKEVEVYYDDVVDPEVYSKIVDGQKKYFKMVTYFAWEKLDLVDTIKLSFGL